jgi:hypothetical protein
MIRGWSSNSINTGFKLVALGCTWLAFSFTLMVTSCSQGTEVENAVTVRASGKVLTPDGNPANNATVTLIKPDYIPSVNKVASGQSPNTDPNIITTQTNKSGDYFLSPSISGRYNVYARLDSLSAKVDTVDLNSNKDVIPNLNLKPAAIFTGIVTILPQHNVADIQVQMVGTALATTADANGKFKFEGFAPGIYRLRFSHIALPNYDTLFYGLKMYGHDTSYRVPFDLKYIPKNISEVFVSGLIITMDTSMASIKVDWKSAKFPSLKRYRLTKTVISASASLSEDTVFSDTNTLNFRLCKDDTDTGCIRKGKWEFKVAAEDTEGTFGPESESVVFMVPDYRELRPLLSLEIINSTGIFVNTNIVLTASWQAFSMPISKIEFVNLTDQTVLSEIPTNLNSTNLTFTTTTPQRVTLGIVSTLENGSMDTVSTTFDVYPENGQALISPDTNWKKTLLNFYSFSMHVTSNGKDIFALTDSYGFADSLLYFQGGQAKSDKYRFGSELKVYSPGRLEFLNGKLFLTNDYGIYSWDSASRQVNTEYELQPTGSPAPQLFVNQNHIFSFGVDHRDESSINFRIINLETKIEEDSSNLPDSLIGALKWFGFIENKYVFVAAQTTITNSKFSSSVQVLEYSILTHRWTTLSDLNHDLSNNANNTQVKFLDGKLYMTNTEFLKRFDFSTSKWIVLKINSDAISTSQGSIYNSDFNTGKNWVKILQSPSSRDEAPESKVYFFSSSDLKWVFLATLPVNGLHEASVVETEGFLHIFNLGGKGWEKFDIALQGIR